jgi:hypothetical protein
MKKISKELKEFIGSQQIKMLMSINSWDRVYALSGQQRLNSQLTQYLLSHTVGVNPFDYMKEIPNRAFENNTDLTSFIIPGNIKHIAEKAFYNCTNLKKINIQNGVCSIARYAFKGCSGLTEIVFPDSVKRIDDQAFNGCDSLLDLVLGKGVAYIGNLAFMGCAKLEKVIFSDNVETIGEEAFSGCDNLYKLSIGKCVNYIDPSAFCCCPKLNEIIVHKDNQDYYSNGDCLIKKDSKTLIKGYNNCVIPSDGSVSTIGQFAYKGNKDMTEIVIPKSVKVIDEGAFEDCIRLNKVSILGDPTKIGSKAFSHCLRLYSITLPKTLTEIAEDSFLGCCCLIEVYNLSSLPVYAGSHGSGYVASHAKDVYCDTSSKSKLSKKDDYVLYREGEEVTVLGYLGTDSKLLLPEEITTIHHWAFANCNTIHSVVIPKSVKEIRIRAFTNCDALDEITVDKDNETFHSEGNCIIETKSKVLVVGCKNSVIPRDGSVTTIGKFAFAGCNGLEKIDIPNGVTMICEAAFNDCENLNEVIVPDSVTLIEDYAFGSCALTTVFLATGTEICDFSFDDDGVVKIIWREKNEK